MFENPRRGRHARNFTTNVSKIIDLKSSSERIFFRKLSLGAPDDWLLNKIHLARDHIDRAAVVTDRAALKPSVWNISEHEAPEKYSLSNPCHNDIVN